MEILKSGLLAVAVIVAVLFALLVFLTGKGDAMSGGSSVRTTFKGKASFDDFISKLTFILGIAFMVLMVGIDVMERRTSGGSSASTRLETTPATPGGNNNTPAPNNNAPAPGTTTTTGQ